MNFNILIVKIGVFLKLKMLFVMAGGLHYIPTLQTYIMREYFHSTVHQGTAFVDMDRLREQYNLEQESVVDIIHNLHELHQAMGQNMVVCYQPHAGWGVDNFCQYQLYFRLQGLEILTYPDVLATHPNITCRAHVIGNQIQETFIEHAPAITNEIIEVGGMVLERMPPDIVERIL